MVDNKDIRIGENPTTVTSGKDRLTNPGNLLQHKRTRTCRQEIFISTTLLGLIAPNELDTNGTLGPKLGVHPLQLTDHNTGISLLLSTSA